MKQIKIITIFTITMASFMLLSFREVSNRSFITADNNTAKVTWAKDNHDFGEILQGKPVSVEFAFTNEGNGPILVADVVTSCGCTASDYTKEPIAPGKSSKIKVTYNAAAIGVFTKTITVNFSDAASKKILNIKGTVK